MYIYIYNDASIKRNILTIKQKTSGSSYVGQTGTGSDFSLCSGVFPVCIYVMLYSRLLIFHRRYLVVTLDNVVKQTTSPLPFLTVSAE